MGTESFTENLSSDTAHEQVERPVAFQGEQQIQVAQAETAPAAAVETAAPSGAPGETVVAVAENNTVKLPAGTSIERIEIDGDNLVLVQPDGTRIVIEHAALHVPTFVINDVEIPQEALVAALQANDINVAAGPDGTLTASASGSESAGGNFDLPFPGIGDAGPIIDLLPPTALQFPELERRELFPGRTNRGPSIDPDPSNPNDPNNPGGIGVSDRIVNEAGLPAGSAAGNGSSVVHGILQLSDPDGMSDIASITINGQTFTVGELADNSVAKSIVGAHGTLTITAYNTTTGVASYSYELTSATTDVANVAETDVFNLAVTDNGGLTGTGKLNIEIVDDVPTAVADTGYGVVEDGLSNVSGNVLTNDVSGADAPKAFDGWSSSDTAAVNELNQYGVLTQNGDGSWSYVLDNSRAATQALSGSFNKDFVLHYTMKDADGDTSSSTLTINVKGANDGPTVTVDTGNPGNANDLVYESGLDGIGSNGSATTEFATGTFKLSDPDGLGDVKSVSINGGAPILIDDLVGSSINGAHGTLTITAYDTTTGVASYSYELTSATTDVASVAETDAFTLTVSDGTTSSAPATITIEIVDDVPTAVADTGYGVVEDGLSNVSGNVLTNDVSGADAPKAFDGWSSSDTAAVNELNQYGVLTQNGDGSWSYVLDNSRAATQALSGSFNKDFVLHYTMKDADGDTSSSTLTINVKGANDGPTVTVDTGNPGNANDLVYESGLDGIGSNGSATTEFATGTFKLSDPDGLGDVKSVSINGGAPILIDDLVGSSINGAHGTLTITAYDTTTGVASYSYELTSATTDVASVAETDAFTLTVSDGTTSSAPATITIEIVDDVPTAVADTGYGVVEDGLSNVSGNVLTNDVSGADAPKAFDGWSSSDTAAVNELNQYGVLTQNGDGSWSYVLDNSRAATQALSGSFNKDFVLHYTMKDADGDTSSSTLTINVKGANDGPTVTVDTGNPGNANDLVYESGLDGIGSNGSATTEFATGTFKLSDPDGLGDVKSVSINGGAPILIDDLVGSSINGAHGTLTITAYDTTTGVASYSYELTSATTDVASVAETDAFTLTVSDGTTSSAPATITIEIVDDVPTAVADTGYGVVEDGLSNVSGNVLTNDVSGADAPKAFDGWSSSDTAAVNELNQYGVLTQNGDGSWSYVLDNSRAATQALSGSFNKDFVLHYTMKDADGDTSSSTLTINVKGANDGPTVTVDTGNPGNANDLVYESGLDGIGSNGSATTEFATGTFKLSDPDGLGDVKSVSINGGAPILIDDLVGSSINGAHGTLTITAYDTTTGVASYSYELTSATTDVASVAETDAFTLTVSDGTTSSAPATITIEIVDDVPTAVADTGYGVVEDGLSNVSGNVLTNDVSGADAPKAFDGWSSSDTAAVNELNQYGVLTQNGDGSWSYVLDNSRAATQALSGSFNKDFVLHYTMKDADGDTSSSTLTINVKGANDGPTVTVDTGNPGNANDLVYESGLDGIGSNGSATTEFATGTFKLSDPDGLGDVKSVSINGGAPILIDDLVGSSINGAHGTLTITAYDTTTGVASYSYELTSATTDVASVAETDAFTLTVSDGTTSSAPATITIEIVDDVPTAVADTGYGVVEDGLSNVSGNVLTNDVSGADAPKAFDGWSSSDTAAVNELNQYGVLTQNGDGSWSYVLDNSRAATQALSGSFNKDFVLHYTMKDADGDTSSSTLTINVKGANDGPTVTVDTGNPGNANDLVYESGLDGIGSNGAATTEFATGTFKLSDPDGLGDVKSVSINGGAPILIGDLVGSSINGAHGTLTITAYDTTTGVASYSYELTSATTDVASVAETDAFTLTVSDGTTSSAPATITIEIVDDVPTARAGGILDLLETAGATSGENLLSNDTKGADGAAVTAVSFDGGATWQSINATGVTVVTPVGGEGTYTFQANGTWTFDPNYNASNADKRGDFTYRITDGDGDTSTALQEVIVRNANSLPSAGTTELTVDDEGLVGGIAGNGQSSGDVSGQAISVTGTLPHDFGGDGKASADPVSFSAMEGQGGTVGTEAVTFHWNASTNTLVATSNSGRGDIFKVVVDGGNDNGNGSYTFTLLKPVIHAAGSGENDATVDLTYTVKDSNGDTAAGVLKVTIDDDTPVAYAQSISVVETTGARTNLLLILDTSGSMGPGSGDTYASGMTNLTKLEILKAAVHELLEQYGNQGDVRVRIVNFASSATSNSDGWVTLAQAKTIVDALSAGGGTNYDAAINQAMSAYNTGGKLSGSDVNNVSYFVSDGEPVNGAVGNTLKTTWETFLNNNDIKSHALGIGANVASTNLEPVAYNGEGSGSEMPAQIVTDLSQLAQTLTDTVAEPVTGNIVTGSSPNGGFGADGGFVKSITVAGVTYTYNPAGAGSISTTAMTGWSFVAATHLLTVTVASGAQFELNMETGAYKFLPGNVSQDTTIPVGFVISDNDGDLASSTLTINITDSDLPPIVRDDRVITNVEAISGADPMVIPHYALLYNDADPDGQPISLTSASVLNSSLNSVNVNSPAGSVTVGDNTGSGTSATDGGKFTYTGTAGGKTDTGVVTVDRSQIGVSELKGTGLGEILLGRDGASDTIYGYEGDDVLIGGSGNESSTPAKFTIVVDGANTSLNSSFLQFAFNSGLGTDRIASISINLRAGGDTDAIFDGTDGSSRNGDGEWGPTPSNLTGLASGNLSYIGSDNAGTLTINFASGTFGVGDKFNLNIDVDRLGPNNADGYASLFAEKGVTATVTMEDGRTQTLTFQVVDSDTGQVVFQLAPPTDDTLYGGAGNDLLIGGSGHDILFGDEGNDVLMGGSGLNTLTGGSGADTFVIDPSALAEGSSMADIITDYKIGEGDVVDLSELLGSNVNAGNIGDFVRTVEGGNGATDLLQVNQSGSGNTADFVTVAHLNADAGVKVLYDDDLTATVNHTP